MAKRILSVFMAIVMLFSVVAVSASALEKGDSDLSEYPVILVQGYSGSALDLVNEDGSTTRVWGLNMDEVVSRILNRIVDLGAGLVDVTKGDGVKLGKTVGEEALNMLGVLACNPDGTSVNNIQLANPIAHNCNMAYLTENGLDEFKGEPELFGYISDLIGEENCYFLTSDWRMSALDCAKRLDEFIQDVKEETGKDKVNLIAVSHGGQVTATYLSLYGYKKDVDNAVMTVPAAGGAVLAYDIMSETIKFDVNTLVYFLEHGFVTEYDFQWLCDVIDTGFVDGVIEGALPYVKQVIGNFTSIWDFIPAEYYDEMKATYLDPVANAGIIEKSDKVHYEIMPNYNEALTKCIEEYGMNVSIIAGTGNPSVTGLQANSDAIIATNDSTGATCAKFGNRFNDGYVGVGTTCNNPLHNHISPSMEVDGTTAYLPENTWYDDELFHGMTFLNDYTLNLALTLLLTDRITDVYSDPAYPQFHASENKCNAVYACFKGNNSGFIGADASELVIKNLSDEYDIKITSVNVSGADLSVALGGLVTIPAGESVTLNVIGEVPAVSGKVVKVAVDYFTEGNYVSPTGSRVFDFTVMNGERVPFDSDNAEVPNDYTSPSEEILGEDTVETLKGVGVFGFISTLLNMFYAFMAQLGLSKYIEK